jgi:hypothetical protein
MIALPEALPVDAMSTFTVLTLHYDEKVCCFLLWNHFIMYVSLDSAFVMGDHQGVRYQYSCYTLGTSKAAA